MRSHEFVTEIERMAARDYTGGKIYLDSQDRASKVYPLPGGSGLVYSIEHETNSPVIKIYDPSQGPAQGAVGKLELESEPSFPVPGTVSVHTITVDEDYRGRGIAKALYGIVLTIMRRPLMAGYSQTPGGRRNWVSLASIPGVDVRGWVSLDELDFRADPAIHDRRLVKQVEQNIDTVMGKLGGQYIGRSPHGMEYFAFDVQPNSSGQELEARVKTNLSRVYHEDYTIRTGLYAQWTGG